MNSERKIAIIGAGMAGIACASKLTRAGLAPVVYEKSGRVGGRMSTRVIDGGFCFDHGAQFFRAKGDAFAEFISYLENKGCAGIWDGVPRSEPIDTRRPMMVGLPAMNELLTPLLSDLDIRFRQRVENVEKAQFGYDLHFENSAGIEGFDYIVSTVPVEQARALFPAEKVMLDKCANVSLLPCWSGMFGFNEKLDCGFDTWRHVNSDIGWIARNSSKPGRGGSKDCWVLHASPRWTLDNLEREKETVARELFEMFNSAMDVALPEPDYLSAHRWRYAQTSEPLGKPFAINEDQTIFVGGDWCLGARVEAAFDSGTAIADAILGKL